MTEQRATSEESSVDFGFSTVKKHEKTGMVSELFSGVARNYDIMNDLMSAGTHRLWKQRFVRALPIAPGRRILDMAGGTGDITLRMRESCSDIRVITADLCPDMLSEGRKRIFNETAALSANCHPVRFSVADAQQLPFADHSFDGYTISFGIRNVADKEKALQEAFRVVNTGGFFACLEFTQLPKGAFRRLYHAYSFNLLPKIGKIAAKNEAAYRYLAESIEMFPDKETFKAMIERAGFQHTRVFTVSGGIAAVHIAYKS